MIMQDKGVPRLLLLTVGQALHGRQNPVWEVI